MEIGVEDLRPGKIYHVYNRSNGKEILFKNDSDYNFFLINIKKYLSPFVNLYAYCLMNNHFHLLLEIKDLQSIKDYMLYYYSKKFHLNEISEIRVLERTYNFPEIRSFISKQFSNMFDSYTKVFNLKYERHGNLFERPFHRKLVQSNDYLKYLFFYIHVNPIRDSKTMKYEDSEWNSYKDYLNGNLELVDFERVLNLFGHQQEYESYHNNMLKFVRSKFDWVELKRR
ncbi:MAG: transposase [Bacteroidetes bacterium]|nr:transposase [Bacteroidota bacterium]